MMTLEKLDRLNELKSKVTNAGYELSRAQRRLDTLNSLKEKNKNGWDITILLKEESYNKTEAKVLISFDYVQQQLVDYLVKAKRDLQEAEYEFANYE